ELLHAKTTASGITTVAGRAACFLMCHGPVSLFLVGLIGLLGRGLLRRLFSGGFVLGGSGLLGGRLLGRSLGLFGLGRGSLGLSLLGRSLFGHRFGLFGLGRGLDRRL